MTPTDVILLHHESFVPFSVPSSIMCTHCRMAARKTKGYACGQHNRVKQQQGSTNVWGFAVGFVSLGMCSSSETLKKQIFHSWAFVDAVSAKNGNGGIIGPLPEVIKSDNGELHSSAMGVTLHLSSICRSPSKKVPRDSTRSREFHLTVGVLGSSLAPCCFSPQ